MAYNPEERAKAFTSRLGKGSTPQLIEDIETAFRIPAAAGAKAAAIRRDTSLSPSGHRFQVARMLSSGPIQHLAQLKSNVARQKQEAIIARAALVPKPDKTDTFSEMQRAEARTLLRSLSHTERMRLVYESQDPVLHEAIAFASPQLSGVTEEQRNMFLVS